jgi:hypothetical protein
MCSQAFFLLHENHPNKWNAVQMRTNESRVIIGFSGFAAAATTGVSHTLVVRTSSLVATDSLNVAVRIASHSITLDYAGPDNPLAIIVVAVLPSSYRNGVGILFHRFSKLNSPAHR